MNLFALLGFCYSGPSPSSYNHIRIAVLRVRVIAWIKDRRWDALLLLLLLLLLVVGVKTLAEVSDVRAPVARQGRAEHFANNEQ